MAKSPKKAVTVKAASKTPKKRGPKKIQVDYAQLEELCNIQATAEECAAVLGMSEDTLSRRIQEDHGIKFAEYRKKHSLAGKASLRRMQWRSAQRGSVPMQIFLGKNDLGQSDKATIAGEDGGAVKVAVDLQEFRDGLKDMISAVRPVEK
jgi:hypothetical protein